MKFVGSKQQLQTQYNNQPLKHQKGYQLQEDISLHQLKKDDICFINS